MKKYLFHPRKYLSVLLCSDGQADPIPTGEITLRLVISDKGATVTIDNVLVFGDMGVLQLLQENDC